MQTDLVLSTNDQSEMSNEQGFILPELMFDSVNVPELAKHKLRPSKSRPVPIQSNMVIEAPEPDEQTPALNLRPCNLISFSSEAL